MAYATIDNIRDRAPQIPITGTSKPDEETVIEWIDEQEKELDAFLETVGYVTPVTGEQSVAILRDMMVQKMIALILRARLYGIGDVNGSGAIEAEKFYDARIKWLKDPTDPFVLPDAEMNGNQPVTGGVREFGFTPDEDDPAQAPRASMAKVF